MRNLVVLGDAGVGKTALVLQFTTKNFLDDYDPTIEELYYTQIVIDKKLYKLDILDTAGLDSYADLQETWIRSGDSFILVYDISSKASFGRIPGYYDEIRRVMKLISYPNGQVPMILVGNKCDKYDGREVSIKDGEALAQSMGCEYIETSAKNDFNVGKAFCNVMKRRQRTYATALKLSEESKACTQGVRKCSAPKRTFNPVGIECGGRTGGFILV